MLRPGDVAILAKLFGRTGEAVSVTIDDGPVIAMAPAADTALWRATVSLAAGLHRVAVLSGADRDSVQILVRGKDGIPHRGVPIAPGCDVHAFGSWPEHGIEGARLGPNDNGSRQ